MAERNRTEQTSRREGSAPREGALTRREHYDPFQASLGGGLLGGPFSLMRRMMEDFDRAWGDFGGQSRNRGGLWAPAIEVSQREGQLTVCAELPGLAKEDVKIEVTDDALIIEGERKQESSSDEGGFRRSERSYGRFYRSIPLPDGAKAEEAKANFSNGVLEVKMPVSEPQSNRRRITVEGS